MRPQFSHRGTADSRLSLLEKRAPVYALLDQQFKPLVLFEQGSQTLIRDRLLNFDEPLQLGLVRTDIIAERHKFLADRLVSPSAVQNHNYSKGPGQSRRSQIYHLWYFLLQEQGFALGNSAFHPLGKNCLGVVHVRAPNDEDRVLSLFVQKDECPPCVYSWNLIPLQFHSRLGHLLS